jgi:O-antigen/teichoic acid export membrane protein
MLAVLVIVGGGFAAQLLTTVTAVVTARMLGVEGRGQVLLVASLAGLISQLTLGGSLPNAITKQLADRGVTARDGLRHLVPRWLMWGLAFSAVAGAYFLFLQRDSSGAAKYALAAGVAVMAVQTMAARILVGAMLGEGTSLVQIALTGLLPQFLTTVVVTTAFALGARWNAVEVIVVTIALVSGVLLVRLRVLAKPTQRESDVLDGRELHALARSTHIGSVGPIDGLAIDRTLVGSLLGTLQLGLYSAASALAGLTSILGGSLASVVLPRIAVAQEDPVAERRLVRRWLLFSAALILVVVVALIVSARFIIRVAFGAEFIGAASCAHWLVGASGLLDFRRVLIAVLQGRGRGAQASVIELSLTPFVIGGIVLASRNKSLVGVGVTMLVVGLVACTVLGVAVMRSGRGDHTAKHRRPADRTIQPTVPPVAAPGDAVALDYRGTWRVRTVG